MQPVKLLLTSVLSTGLLAAALPALAGSLTVEFSTPSDADGNVFAGLFDSADGFPKKGGEKIGQTVPSQGTQTTVVFANLAPGRYAISAFLDRNNNGALDTNVLGVPKEPYGFSRNARGTMGPPGFAEAAIEFNGKDQKIVIQLK